MNNVRPSLTLLKEEQIQQVHQYVLRILCETGVRVDAPNVVDLLKKTGQVQVQDRNIKFSTEIIEQSLHSTPATIQMFDRSGDASFLLGDDRLRFGVGHVGRL